MARSPALAPPAAAIVPTPHHQREVNNHPPPPQISSRLASSPKHAPSLAGTPSATSHASASAPTPRAPLPDKQPRPKAAGAKTLVASTSLPRLSAPPVEKMTMAAVVGPTAAPPEGPKMSMTSKEWVIPPRPKPGRKPATDTPPTKRKAQNRAAQRAFRERRAARVGELEEHLEQQRDLRDKTEAELKDKIHGLELDLQSFRSRCMLLENMLERERQDRLLAETQAETPRRRRGDGDVLFRAQSVSEPLRHAYSRPRSPTQAMATHGTSDHRHAPPSSSRNFSISHIITPPDVLDMGDGEAALTCGNCSPAGPCPCADEALASVSNACGRCSFGSPCQCLGDIEAVTGEAQEPILKRPSSPSSNPTPPGAAKRQRCNPGAVAAVEVDFTAIFARKSAPASSVPPSPYQLPPSDSQVPSASTDAMPFKDSCGFCKDGTYCVCAEEAAAMTTPAMTTPAMTPTADALPPMSHQTQTPPPSEPDTFVSTPLSMEMTADGAVKLPRRRRPKAAHKKPTTADSRGCGADGPGTCAQCQADPKAGLFCRLMSAKFDRENGGPGGGCCGGKGPGGGCCKSGGPEKEKVTLPSLPSLGLSCAEAYQTLSSHRNFDRAADEIGTWLPKLKATTPNSPRDDAHRGRHAVEVEAASIMSVLKEFDVRFGREC
ncbi:bZIP transcription factor [Drechmeria coniospora]|uniref:BZIP transcription factor n=1 Tax=Drechmeria coniospora TaxID=98403 RepID=A0A151GGC6_DRECN|nr:bZIP transcription factor [Drechmeria coniospora]KYK56116.1 bZIP transcription factor [Drechmeria coniospora]ODA76399.1 hypothetical protein RJ55_08245 [Drechmeria coniospora]